MVERKLAGGVDSTDFGLHVHFKEMDFMMLKGKRELDRTADPQQVLRALNGTRFELRAASFTLQSLRSALPFMEPRTALRLAHPLVECIQLSMSGTSVIYDSKDPPGCLMPLRYHMEPVLALVMTVHIKPFVLSSLPL
jgi:hypothetical protein